MVLNRFSVMVVPLVVGLMLMVRLVRMMVVDLIGLVGVLGMVSPGRICIIG